MAQLFTMVVSIRHIRRFHIIIPHFSTERMTSADTNSPFIKITIIAHGNTLAADYLRLVRDRDTPNARFFKKEGIKPAQAPQGSGFPFPMICTEP